MEIVIVVIVLLVLIWVIVASGSSAKKRKEELRAKYRKETPARRALILQLYADGIDLKEITFILRRADYRGVEGEEITMKEIMEEHAQIQINTHREALKAEV